MIFIAENQKYKIYLIMKISKIKIERDHIMSFSGSTYTILKNNRIRYLTVLVTGATLSELLPKTLAIIKLPFINDSIFVLRFIRNFLNY